MPRTTFNRWKHTGQAILDANCAGSSFRQNYKQTEEKEEFEEEVLRRIRSSRVDVEGVAGVRIICEEVRAEERFHAMEQIRKLESAPDNSFFC